MRDSVRLQDVVGGLTLFTYHSMYSKNFFFKSLASCNEWSPLVIFV
jgi:hypothetical protein